MKKFSKIKKNILRTMVKTPAQTDGPLKSYEQKTAEKSPLYVCIKLKKQYSKQNS